MSEDKLKKQKAKLLDFIKQLSTGSKNQKLTTLLLYSYQIREETAKEVIKLKDEGISNNEIEKKYKSPV